MAKRSLKKNRERKNQKSRISQHRRSGKLLIPPARQIENLQFSSWMDERLPEMLWAALLVAQLEREHALQILRSIGYAGSELAGYKQRFDITLTGLPELPDRFPRKFIEMICFEPEARIALSPLLLLDELPGRALWHEMLTDVRDESSWEALMSAVGVTIYHQSTEATDCRWVKVLFSIACGMPTCRGETTLRGILEYPDYGDMKGIQSSIRANEIVPNPFQPFPVEWSNAFWSQCLRDTPCIQQDVEESHQLPSIAGTRVDVRGLYTELVAKFHNSRTTTSVDPRHDTTMGIALYCCSLLEELMGIGIPSSVIARHAIRSILESFITLGYLAKRDDPELWSSYRVYGAGQAKLALLKLEESTDQPEFVTQETLKRLANEDIWQEFLTINVGHWDKINTRIMSENAGLKEIYDRYYPWTSQFVHGQWGAIRDSVFQTCMNPLHRLHRIPVESTRMLPDTIADASFLINGVLGLVDELYPPFTLRLKQP